MYFITKAEMAIVKGGGSRHRAELDHLGSYNVTISSSDDIEFQDGDDYAVLRKRPGRA